MSDFEDAASQYATGAEAPPPLTRAATRKAITAASVGNALEFYDFVTFAFFAIQIGRTFSRAGAPILV